MGFPSTTVMMGMISLGFFMGGSALLYLDVLGWPLPPTPGSVWMFHTNLTGIAKADVHTASAVFMLLIYPLWHVLGYLVALRLDVGSFMIRVVSYNDVKSRREKPTPQFVVVRGGDSRDLVQTAVTQLGGIHQFVKRGDQVLIKANICGGNPTIRGSYTSVPVIDALVAMIRDAGAQPMVVDSDMIWTKFDVVADAEGWTEWAEKARVPLFNLADMELTRFNFGEDSTIGIVPVSKMMVEANVIISVPTMKTHLLTNVTLGMKNMYGTFPEENKAKYHRFGIENVVYEVNKAFTPHLTIIDGTVGGEAFGPLSSKPVDFQTIIASNDVVAADAIACRLMGYDPFDIDHVKRAHEGGVGYADVEFDLSTLVPSHTKDGAWERPDPAVTYFYEQLVEAFLLLPGMQDFFDVTADFVLYDLATLPVFREITQETERAFNFILGDILHALVDSGYSRSEVSILEVLEKAIHSRAHRVVIDRGMGADVDTVMTHFLEQIQREINLEIA